MRNRFSKKTNREAAVAGQFYPAGKNELQNQLRQLFEFAQPELYKEKKLQAIISPHAGYIFSGGVAASAFNQINENTKYKRVFVLASSHRFLFGGAAVYTSGNYETPLGEIEVDTRLLEKLIKTSDLFVVKPEAHEQEHSLEVQLPFLQTKLGNNFLLVPIILGTNSAGDCKAIAAVLKPWFTPENLFVISTDFSHYPNSADAKKVDKNTADAICSNRPQKLLEILDENKKAGIGNLATSLCGWTSVLTLLYLTENSDFQFEQIEYKNSGDSEIYGDKNSVVGYHAIAVYDGDDSMVITRTEKKEIIEKARHSIEIFLKSGKKGELIKPVSNGILNEITGAFVTIYINGKLRGCIGGFAQEKTLNELVQSMAVSAARDSRFKPVKTEELDKMELEISVLSPLKKIENIDEIELGKHGILIRQGYNSGTFLPQVIEKTDWDVEQFLGHCARDKAGIGWDGWKTADVFIYEAVVFKENEHWQRL
jgi:AmmeMemoRadiSam system protein B/AmmeMemoRadiSam system protein A